MMSKIYWINEEQCDAIEQIIEDLYEMDADGAIELEYWPEALHFIETLRRVRKQD